MRGRRRFSDDWKEPEPAPCGDKEGLVGRWRGSLHLVGAGEPLGHIPSTQLDSDAKFENKCDNERISPLDVALGLRLSLYLSPPRAHPSRAHQQARWRTKAKETSM